MWRKSENADFFIFLLFSSTVAQRNTQLDHYVRGGRVNGMNREKMALSVGTLVYSLLRLLGGLFLIWGQLEHRQPGTFYGLDWPHNWHTLLADLNVIFLWFGAVLLIYLGIFGQEKLEKRTTEVK
jgi:hypothetical protein